MKNKISIVLIVFLMILLVGCGKSTDSESVSPYAAPEPVDGVTYTPWLRLDDDAYVVEQSEVTYTINDFGNYLIVYLESHSEEEKTINTDYRVERKINDEYVEVERGNVNLIYAGTHVNHMTPVIARDWSQDEHVELEITDGSIIVQPGQRVRIDFLMLNHSIFDSEEYEGDYRLIFDDVVIDFKLYLDFVC